MSSRTISLTGISRFFPFRNTFAVGADSMESLSILIFARISCTIATMMLQQKITTNVNWESGACARINATVAIRQRKLKNVQMFPKKMLPYVLEYFFGSLLFNPCSMRRAACSSVSPVFVSGEKRTISSASFVFSFLFFFFFVPAPFSASSFSVGTGGGVVSFSLILFSFRIRP